MRLARLTVPAALVLSLFAAPHPVEAQPAEKIWRIGFLGSASQSGYAPLVDALRQGLRDFGYAEGKNLVIESRWAEGQYARLYELAVELVQLKVDVIVTHGLPGGVAAKQATATTPIVLAISGDVVSAGLAASIARPGGNLTGSTFFFPELNAKRVELLKEAVPRASRIAAMANADNPGARQSLEAMQPVAKSLIAVLVPVWVRGPSEFREAFSGMVRDRIDGLVVIDDGMLIANVREVVELALKHRLPSIGFRECAEAGGLLAYAVNFPVIWRRAAYFVDKIFKGAKPAELPIEQATRFEFVVNLRTARTLRLTIPPSVLARADEVIE